MLVSHLPDRIQSKQSKRGRDECVMIWFVWIQRIVDNSWSLRSFMNSFFRYIGIDYSGAQTPRSGLKGLRVYMAEPETEPQEIFPIQMTPKWWSREALALWLVQTLRDSPPALIGIDHAFCFPLNYFEAHDLEFSWPSFLEDFTHHWPTHEPNMYVDFVRDGLCGRGDLRAGSSRWRRLCDQRCRAKSPFHFDVPGSVAKSTHAGLPWLLHLRRELGEKVHFWPFDGWSPPVGVSVIAEAYPALSSRSYPREDRTPDQHDAYAVARWLRDADGRHELETYFNPEISEKHKMQANVEGWILGVLG